MIEFAAHFGVSLPFLGQRRPRRAETMALQSLFKALANSLPGPFPNPAVNRGLGAKARNIAKNFPNLALLGGAGAESFQTKIRPPTPPQRL